MKFLKYSIAAIVVLALIAVSAYLYRDSIARKVANRALRNQDLRVVDLSVDSIGGELVEFSELILEQSDGSQIRIEGISLPVSISSPRPTELTIASVSLEQSDDEKPPAALAKLLQIFLDIPAAISNTTVRVDRLSIPKLPPMANILWQSGDTSQNLQLDIERFSTSIEVAERTGTGYQATAITRNADSSIASAMNLQIERQESGLIVVGSTRIDLESWLPVYQLIGIVPPELASLNGVLAGPITIELHDDPSVETSITARLSPEEALSVGYQVEDSELVNVSIATMAPLQTSFYYPSLAWSAALDAADLLVTAGSLSEIPAHVADVSCRSGIRCELGASMQSDSMKLGDWSAATVNVVAPLTIAVGDGVQVGISQESTFFLGELQSGSTTIRQIDSRQLADVELMTDDEGWHLTATTLGVHVGNLELDAGIMTSFDADLTTFLVSNSGATITADFAVPVDSMSLSYADTAIVPPAANGHFKFENNSLTAEFELATPDGALSASISTSHNVENGIGSMRVTNARADLGSRPLSKSLRDWPHAWDVIGGTWRAKGNIDWVVGEDDTSYSAEFEHSITDLAGTNKESAFAGLNMEVTMAVGSEEGLSLPPAELQLELLDVGIPIENLSARFSLNPGKPVLVVDALSMNLLGGEMVAEPFSFDPEARNKIILSPKSVQLEFIVGLLDFEKLSMEGSASGRLPLTVTKERVTIDGGRLASDEPGGSIRYGSGGSDLATVDSELGLVSRALANFQFKSLTSDVSYDEAGDLVLQMRLEGVNPDMDATQPVILNLNVENNIPQMLKSLQATRSIQEILEKKVAN